MSVTPDEVLALARELYNGGNASEARVRSSISRAYYAAYHSAVACAGVELPSLEAHRALIDRYDSLGKIALAGRLRSMRAARVTADYYLSRPVAGKQASISLSQAVEIINELQPPHCPRLN